MNRGAPCMAMQHFSCGYTTASVAAVVGGVLAFASHRHRTCRCPLRRDHRRIHGRLYCLRRCLQCLSPPPPPPEPEPPPVTASRSPAARGSGLRRAPARWLGVFFLTTPAAAAFRFLKIPARNQSTPAPHNPTRQRHACRCTRKDVSISQRGLSSAGSLAPASS